MPETCICFFQINGWTSAPVKSTSEWLRQTAGATWIIRLDLYAQTGRTWSTLGAGGQLGGRIRTAAS